MTDTDTNISDVPETPEVAEAKPRRGRAARLGDWAAAPDQRVGAGAWQIRIWAPAQRDLIDAMIERTFEGAKRPVRQDDNWLRVHNQSEAKALVAAAVEEMESSGNDYHRWLLDLFIAQVRQAYPKITAPDKRLASRVVSTLNDLRETGAITDWRAFTPPGPTKLSFRVSFPDGTTEDLIRPRAAMTRIESLAPAA